MAGINVTDKSNTKTEFFKVLIDFKNSSLPDSQLTSLPNASKQVTDSPLLVIVIGWTMSKLWLLSAYNELGRHFRLRDMLQTCCKQTNTQRSLLK